MPIRQPVQTTIRADDFYDKAFSFPLESIVDSELIPEKLVINVPEGYLLTTSLTNEPRREQAFPYRKLPGGQWISEGIVTLLFTGDQPTAGKLVIHNSLDEKIVLTVNTSLTLSKKPELRVSAQLLTISQSSANKPGFGLLTIAQQHANTPVTITTDLPEFFQLASDSRPAFGPSLQIIPSAIGTYVHVRYYSGKRSRHSGQLIIDAPYGSKTVTVEGQRTSLLPMLQTGIVVANSVSARWKLEGSRWIPILLVGIASGLGLVSYQYRCQLFPGLCQDKTARQGEMGPDSLRLAPPIADKSLKRSESEKVISKPTKPASPIAESDSVLARNPGQLPVEEPRSQPTLVKVLTEQRADEPVQTTPKSITQQRVDSQLKNRAKRRQDSTTADKESELERALNPPD